MERIAVGVGDFDGTEYSVDVIYECRQCKKLFKHRIVKGEEEMSQLIATTVIPTLHDILGYLDPTGALNTPEDREIVPPET